jgi:uncharacterized sodium:solute symporter family permease YidK
MMRVLIESMMLFLLPAALYLSFAFLTRRDDTSTAAVLNRAPMVTLAFLGALLMGAVLAIFGNVGYGKPGDAYEPAVFKDGKVIPGRMR